MIYNSISDINNSKTFLCLEKFAEGNDVYLKIEGFNAAGSIKLKTAISMVQGLEERGLIKPHCHSLIESSSGNLGVALSIICASRGYGFICVVDPNASEHCVKLIRLYGGKIIRVFEKDENGGYLSARINKIQEIIEKHPDFVWTNQYANHDNPMAHYHTTAPEILEEFEKVDYLFVGSSTTGTLVGCCKYFSEHSPETRLIAVEPEGSVTFGASPATRLLPGLGASRIPELASQSCHHNCIYVSELDSIRTCRLLLEKYSLFAGASTGTVLAAVQQYLKAIRDPGVVVAISPDLGDKYIDNLYCPEWVYENYQEK